MQEPLDIVLHRLVFFCTAMGIQSCVPFLAFHFILLPTLRLCLAATVHQLFTGPRTARQQPFVGQNSQSILGSIPQMKVMITTTIPRYVIVLFERLRQMEHAIVITVVPNKINGNHSAKTMGSYQTPLIHHTTISALYVSTKAFMAVIRRSLSEGKIFIVFWYLLLSLCLMIMEQSHINK